MRMMFDGGSKVSHNFNDLQHDVLSAPATRRFHNFCRSTQSCITTRGVFFDEWNTFWRSKKKTEEMFLPLAVFVLNQIFIFHAFPATN